MNQFKNKKHVTQLEFGDIVSMKCDNHTPNHADLGFVFEIEKKEIQILPMKRIPIKQDVHKIPIEKEDLINRKLSDKHYIITNKMFPVNIQSVKQKIDRVQNNKIDEILRSMSHLLVEKHYHYLHQKDAHFIPGETLIRYAGRYYNAEEMKNLIDASLDFWLTSGKYTKQFEQDFTQFLNVKYCLLTNSGSSANLLAISSLTSPELGERRLKPGDEVITTACAFPTTVNAILQNNLVPVFLDVDIGTYNIKADHIKPAISKRTKAIFLAHTLGNPFDLDVVLQNAKDHNLWIVEDNCDALGSKYRKKYTGTLGHIGTFSFYPPHHITMGEGGALVTNDTLLKKLIASFRDWGRDCWCDSGMDNTCKRRFGWKLGDLPFGYDHKYIYSHIGYNLKITDMQAAIGVAQLKKICQFIEIRKRNWKTLFEGLKKHEKFFILPKVTKNANPSWFGFPLTVREEAPFTKMDIVTYLENNKIATRMLFAGNIIRQPSFINVKYRVFDNLKNTDIIMNRTFWIGIYPGIKDDMLQYIIHKFNEFIIEMGG